MEENENQLHCIIVEVETQNRRSEKYASRWKIKSLGHNNRGLICFVYSCLWGLTNLINNETRATGIRKQQPPRGHKLPHMLIR